MSPQRDTMRNGLFLMGDDLDGVCAEGGMAGR